MAGRRRGAMVMVAALSVLTVLGAAGCAGNDGAVGPDSTAPGTGTTMVGGCPEGPGSPAWTRARYDLDGLVRSGADGGGVRVALIAEGESADEAAVAAGAGCDGSDAVLDQQSVAATDLPPAGDRTTFDAQAVLAAAPGIDELLVLAVEPASDGALLDALDLVGAGAFGRIDVLVAPTSRCLAAWDVAVVEQIEGRLARLEGQGVWVVAAAGDAGSTPCAPLAVGGVCPSAGADVVVATGYPASSQHVLAVGGTMVADSDQLEPPPEPEDVALGPDGIGGTADDGTGPPTTLEAEPGGGVRSGPSGAVEGAVDSAGDGEVGEDGDPEAPTDVVWSERWLAGAEGCRATGGGKAAGGPGIAAPDWQAGGLRQVPDVVLLAGPPGLIVMGGDGRTTTVTGTGTAAALTAGGLASVRSSLRTRGLDLDTPVAEAVWLVAGEQAASGASDGAPIVEDVDTGSNDLLDVGCCRADAGYDLASGWGTVRFTAFAAALVEADGVVSWPREAVRVPPVSAVPTASAER